MSQTVKNPKDLEHIFSHVGELWEDLRNKRIFITGGTGLYGCWLLESLIWANDKLGLDAHVVVLTRNPDGFRGKAPRLAAHPMVSLHTGDMTNFAIPDGGFDFVIHAASELSLPNQPNPFGMLESSIRGTMRVLELAAQCGVKKLLFTSSGAVYGPRIKERERSFLRETDGITRLQLDSQGAYAEAKRASELLCVLAGKKYGFEAKLARGFAVIGPYSPLDSHFAAGNFIRDSLNGGPLIIQGNGTTVRSYLYGADLAIWLWTILLRGKADEPYNLGSDQPVSVAELARIVAEQTFPTPEIKILGRVMPGEVVDFYVPDTSKARTELGLDVFIPLKEAISRTLAFFRK